MATTDTDEDATKCDPSPAQWELFEQEVRDSIERIDERASVRWNYSLPGRISGTVRQIDVYATGTVAGQEISIVIECKRYKRPLGIGIIDEFAGKMQDIGADRGIIYGLNGLTGPAKRRARGAVQPRIAIGDLIVGAHTPVDVEPLLKFGDCSNTNCMFGDISWETWRSSSNSTVEVGACSACGTWSIQCPEDYCGQIDGFFTDDQLCSACGTRSSLRWDSDYVDVVAVEVDPPGKESAIYVR